MQRSESASNQSSISSPQQISNKPIRYIHGYTPIKLTRQMLKNTHCYTALSNVECQIETLTTRSNGTKFVQGIYRFRFDEDKIWVHKCNKPLPFRINETPQCPPDALCYSHDSLPAEYWYKYTNVTRFMTLIRIKTPKITINTDVAKAVLFDFPGFFEVRFFADSTKIIFNDDVIRIVKVTGEEFTLTAVNDSVTISEDMKLLLDKANELYEIAKRENLGEIFPKVIGTPLKQTQLKQAQQEQIVPDFPHTFPIVTRQKPHKQVHQIVPGFP